MECRDRVSDRSDLVAKLERAVEAGEDEEAASAARKLLELGAAATEITDGLSRAMARLGDRFRRLDVFVPDLMVAADAFEAAMRVVEPQLRATPREPKGTIVIGVVEGDIHTLGKNLVRVMLQADGFAVHDLGRDVRAATFVEQAERVQADIIAMSSLMTTTMGRMKEVLEELVARGRRDRYGVLVGGAPVTQQFAEEIGADGYGEDVSEAVAAANRLMSQRHAAGGEKP